MGGGGGGGSDSDVGHITEVNTAVVSFEGGVASPMGGSHQPRRPTTPARQGSSPSDSGMGRKERRATVVSTCKEKTERYSDSSTPPGSEGGARGRGGGHAGRRGRGVLRLRSRGTPPSSKKTGAPKGGGSRGESQLSASVDIALAEQGIVWVDKVTDESVSRDKENERLEDISNLRRAVLKTVLTGQRLPLRAGQ